MNKTYFGFALADGMFQGDCAIERKVLTVDEAKGIIAQGVESCLNPSHKATIDAMNSKFGIEVAIPEAPPRVSLNTGDSGHGRPRLAAAH